MNATSGFPRAVGRDAAAPPELRMVLVIVCLGLYLQLSSSTAEGDLLVTSASRGVMAGATGAIPDTDSTPLPGAYLKDATAVGMSPAGTISSFAHHDSFIPGYTGPIMFGTGSASATATATGFTGFSNIADSRFEVSFEVTSTGFYDFDAGVDWTGTTPPYLGFAKVELRNVTAGTTIGAIISDPMSPGVHSLLSSYLLTTGTHYELVAEVEVSGGFATAGSYGASGSWHVVVVPEPSSFILCCTGLVWLGSIRRRQIRLTCWMSSNYYAGHSRGCDAVKSSKRKSEESPDRSGSQANRRRC